MYLRKSMFLVTIFLVVLSLIGCTTQKVNTAKANKSPSKVELEDKIISNITISEVGESPRDMKEPYISYKEDKTTELQAFADAIKQLKETRNTDDIGKANYMLAITFADKTYAKYLLWLQEDSGIIMNMDNPYKMYALPESSIEDLHNYMK
jgi:hypothetical protein